MAHNEKLIDISVDTAYIIRCLQANIQTIRNIRLDLPDVVQVENKNDYKQDSETAMPSKYTDATFPAWSLKHKTNI